jgi:MFS family permease
MPPDFESGLILTRATIWLALTCYTLAQPRPLPALLARIPVYYGWIILGAAARGMVGTLPGRTQGLGLITESLLIDLRIDRINYAGMNLWASLLGSLFCLGFGRWLDRWGARALLTGIALALGGVVLGMSLATTAPVLFLWLVLSRGLGQSALSIVSLALVGQWFRPRLHLAMGLFALLLSVGFMIAFPVVGSAVIELGWRPAWVCSMKPSSPSAASQPASTIAAWSSPP